MPLPPTSTPIAMCRCPGSICGPVTTPALSWSSSTVFFASFAASAAIFSVALASGASLRAGLTAPPASGSWFTMLLLGGSAGAAGGRMCVTQD